MKTCFGLLKLELDSSHFEAFGHKAWISQLTCRTRHYNRMDASDQDDRSNDSVRLGILGGPPENIERPFSISAEPIKSSQDDKPPAVPEQTGSSGKWDRLQLQHCPAVLFSEPTFPCQSRCALESTETHIRPRTHAKYLRLHTMLLQRHRVDNALM